MAAIKFGVSQNKVIWRLLNLASLRLCSVRSTSLRPTYVGATNISENMQFAKFTKYNSTPKFVDLQYLTFDLMSLTFPKLCDNVKASWWCFYSGFLWLSLQVLIRANCLNISSMFSLDLEPLLMSFRRYILFPIVHIVLHGFLNLVCTCVFVSCNAVAGTRTIAFEEFGILCFLPLLGALVIKKLIIIKLQYVTCIMLFVWLILIIYQVFNYPPFIFKMNTVYFNLKKSFHSDESSLSTEPLPLNTL